MINERGIWTSETETDIHSFDELLCKTIGEKFHNQETILDLGCGNGLYTKHLSKSFKVWGYDGSPLTQDITGGRCAILDLSKPIDIGVYDVVLCLEVGEHIPKEYEQIFINNVCKSARNFVILSWAVIDQPGYGHVNCHDNEYVIKEMNKRGFLFDNITSDELRAGSTLPWFSNTVMVFYHG